MAKVIVGVDEVGRGPWAGPLVAAAVAWPNGKSLRGLKDSKLLKRGTRASLASKIRSRASAIGIGWVSHTEIDRHGLTWANRVAMLRALNPIRIDKSELIIDGKFNFLAELYPHAQAIIKADSSVPAVSAASIIAKVARDNYMIKQAQEWPNYGFERHVGYGTRLHIEKLFEFGPCRLHRQSFKPIWVSHQALMRS